MRSTPRQARGYQASQDGAAYRLGSRRLQRPVRRARHYSPAMLRINSAISCRDSALRYECHEELLDPSNSLSGYAQAVRHLTAAGFDLKGKKAHKMVGGQLP